MKPGPMPVIMTWIDIRTVLLASLIFLVSFLILNLFRTKRRNLPPGPWGFPGIGNPFAIANATPFRTFRDLAAKYGDVFLLHIGTRRILVLNSYDAMKEALVGNGEDFVNRPPVLAKIGTMDNGVVMSNGPIWKFKRRIILSNLRNFGMGKTKMEKRILDETGYLLHDLGNHEGKMFDPREYFINLSQNIVCLVTLGERFDYEDPRFKTTIAMFDSLFEIGRMYLGAGTAFPWASSVLDIVTGKEGNRIHETLYGIVEPFLKEHDETYDPENMRDFIDVFLKITKDFDEETEEHPFDSQCFRGLPYHYYYEYSLILDIFAAGSETTNMTLMWGMLFMLKYPDIQNKVQEELDKVVGKDRLPNMADRVNLPYTEATITEVLRLAATVPLSVPRWTVRDTHVYGYEIPKDTLVLPNIWNALRDPELWENPDSFEPDRFIDSDGNFTRPDKYIPFGLGPRVCLGEQLAKMELFLVFSCVLKTYNLEVDDGYKLPEMNGRMHITLQPPKFKMRVFQR